ncbi:hypothetical protein O6H91_11G022300 [Diphasiastrum complanatum]|uniref:Uncharacterized protein n=1 Tax=Diphasiastrum complanatum TaxID=34168 RepID=A0ACC2C6Z1_DIPCM|nr:hypothetical protein O6H91_11G022300 [Diphasiastrum complanatum]
MQQHIFPCSRMAIFSSRNKATNPLLQGRLFQNIFGILTADRQSRFSLSKGDICHKLAHFSETQRATFPSAEGWLQPDWRTFSRQNWTFFSEAEMGALFRDFSGSFFLSNQQILSVGSTNSAISCLLSLLPLLAGASSQSY